MTKCPWAAKKRFVINPDGQVWPCCYFANIDYLNKKLRNQGDNQAFVYKKYNERRSDFNVNNHPVHEILQDEWFNITLPQSWDKLETTHRACKNHCGINNKDSK